MAPRKTLGLIVNPIAGMGGAVGLKGTDGSEVLKRAIEQGAAQTAPIRATEALMELSSLKKDIDLVTYPCDMGDDEAKACGIAATVIGPRQGKRTTSADTKNAARQMLRLNVNLILFAGGDGTARDLFEIVGGRVVVLGVPAGVKMHSGVFAANPRSAGRLAAKFLQGKAVTCEREVMDVDEEAFRQGKVAARLYGYLKVPYEEQVIQDPKIGGGITERRALEEISWHVIDSMEDDCLYVIGPGTTTKYIMRKLGLQHTLLGVDVIDKTNLIALDVNETELLKLVRVRKAKIVVTVIGGQGFIFGRGNQQISPRVIREVGKENIFVVASESKIASLGGKPLFVDTGDEEIDQMLKGYIKIVTGYRKTAICRVA